MHALSSLGWCTFPVFLGLLPSPDPSAFASTPPHMSTYGHLHKAPPPEPPAAATCFLLLLASAHFAPPGPAPVPACPEFWVSAGLVLTGVVSDFWDRSPVGCSLDLRVAKIQNLTSLPHMWGHLGLVPSPSALQAPHSWGEEKSHAHVEEVGCADVIAEVGVMLKPPQHTVLPHSSSRDLPGVSSVQE